LPGVTEVAAFAVPSDIEGGEDEIMLAIVPALNERLSPTMVVEHAQQVPRFARPRYVEFMTDLPKTASEKVKKAELKSRGVTPKTIDLSTLFRDS